MTGTVTRPAWAKLNLYLHVTGRRADGYHELDSLVVFPKLGDVLAVEPAGSLELVVTGPFRADVPADDGNLALRAARLLSARHAPMAGARIVLDKRLPVAAGIGGGSSDAAAALRGLNELWGLGLADPELADLGLQLGADVPVCLAGEPRRMQGIGERLARVPALPPLGVLLANPGRALATRDVFAARAGAFSAPPAWPVRFQAAEDLARFLKACRNDLEAPAIGLVPEVGRLLARLEALPHVLLARMSGSGATCFALFDSVLAARSAAALLDLPPGAWTATAEIPAG